MQLPKPTNLWEAVKLLLALLLSPIFLIIFLPLVIFCGACLIFAYASFFLGLAKIKRRAKKAGRFLPVGMLQKRLSLEEVKGTFLVDCYTMGWGWTRLWWTPDVLSKAMDEPVSGALPEDQIKRATTAYKRWLYDHYADPDTGTAFLVKTDVSPQKMAELARLFPAIPQIHLWNAAIVFEHREAMNTITPPVQSGDQGPIAEG